MTRFAAKTDVEHAHIRDGLRKAGYRVWDCHKYGSGFPDLLVGGGEHFYLLEIKSKYGKLKPKEQDFFDLFAGHNVFVVHNLEDAVLAINDLD